MSGKDTYVALPDPSDPLFAVRYKELSRPDNARQKKEPGTIGALIEAYKASPDFQDLAENTKRLRMWVLDEFDEKHGGKRVITLSTPAVYRLRDELKDKPGKANALLTALSALMGFAVKRGYRPSNPVSKVERFETGEHAPWPEEILEGALAAASPMLRLAIITGLYSGQRVGDCVRMQHSWIRDGIMILRTEKSQGKTEVFIPIHRTWRAEIDAVPKKALTILYNRYGQPMSDDSVQDQLRRLMRKLGHVDEENQLLYTFHGLRKNACNNLAEVGCTPHEISAITGQSLEIVEHYTRRANRKRLASAAILKLEGR
ncbi:tyrosine-type recombinase/integrase [Pedomonas sp. V897]|uniref:tyrosine-type recombinase/integrase n=1 Tax=Pedomonas sp. V897 TaxID=3446482 RepID=UPI003EDF2AF8